jgi:phytoene synthase
MDLTKTDYATLDETLQYIYGSAEVIGLFMARIMELPEESYEAAKILGRAMQYINFIRDIEEDNSLGRTYLPLSGSGLQSLQKSHAEANKDIFVTFVRDNIALYREWQTKAEEGYKYIPHRYLIAIKTAADMYGWTARVIENDPFVVFESKVKPSKTRIILKVLANAMGIR